MEPERKIEKLLRAFAKKRRADAGDAFSLHPATRRLLHSEVARRAPKPAAGNISSKISGWWQPGYILSAAGFAVVVFIGIALLWPGFNKPKTPSQMAETKNFSTPAAPAAAEPVAKLTPITPPPGLQMEKLDTFNRNSVAAAGTPAPQPLAEGSAAAPATTPTSFGGGGGGSKTINIAMDAKDERSMSRAEKNTLQTDVAARKKQAVAETLADGDAAAMNQPFHPTGAVAGTRTASPVPGTFSDRLITADGTMSNASAARQQFRQQGNIASAQNLFKNASSSKPATPVLANFQFQQNGTAVAVVDEDGSVYNGFLVAADAAKLQDEAVELKRSAARRDMPAPWTAQNFSAEKNAEPPAQNYFFRVSGTNRSLQQNVVFTGNVLSFSNGAASRTLDGSLNSAITAGGNVSQVTDKNLSQQNLFSNSRIAGTAVVNRTNEIEINALPVNP